jgi:hypothetical protein
MSDHSVIDDASEKLFETILQKIDDRLTIHRKDPRVALKIVTRFDELKKYKSLFVHKVTELKGPSGSFIILLLEKHLTIIEQKRTARIQKEIEEIEPILVFSIPQDIGKVYIRKETLADKVTDLFTKIDIDFAEYPNFSKNYYVVGEKPDMVKKHLPKRLMESLEKTADMIIEINGNWGLMRTEKNLTEDVLLSLLRVGYKMTK